MLQKENCLSRTVGVSLGHEEMHIFSPGVCDLSKADNSYSVTNPDEHPDSKIQNQIFLGFFSFFFFQAKLDLVLDNDTTITEKHS